MFNKKGFSKIAVIISSVIILFVVGGGVYEWQAYEAKKAQDTLQKQILQAEKEKQDILQKQEQIVQQAEKEKTDILQKQEQIVQQAEQAEKEKREIKKEKTELEQKYCKGVWKNGVCVIKTCIDSDVNEKPKDIFIKGNVTYTNENGVSTTVYDSCTSNNLQVNEGWCYESPEGSGNYVQGKMVSNCNKGCLDGACKQ